jgi:hypothetical protein
MLNHFKRDTQLTPLNTIPLQQFIQQVKSADLTQQREIKLDIKTAKALAYCLSEINARLVEKLDTALANAQSQTSTISVQMDGGGF